MANITFIGNIGKYHGLKFGQDGKPRTSFSAAETARVKDQSGQWVDGGTTWFNVTLFGNAAEALDAAIPEGKGRVIVTGRMVTREYEHNGEKRESLDVVADQVGIVPRNQQRQTVAAQGNWGAQPANVGGWGNGPGNQSEAPF